MTDIQERNKAMIQEDMENMQAEIQRQSTILTLTRSGFSSQSYIDPERAKHFYQAFDEINAMLKKETALNLGWAVFLVENAFYGNSLNYFEYKDFIKNKIQLCNQKIKEEKLNGNNNPVKNMMLFRLITDTLKIKSTGKERQLIHLPIKYDYDDYQSKQHYDSHFVTKLMRSGVGQCYSMPLYYLILAEAAGAEAYWAFSPRHSFVKIQDEDGVWYNLELTCGAILSDAHYMNNSYIKAEAIRNRLYLEPLDKTNTVAHTLLDLARYYFEKFGLDNFYLQCVETAAQYLSNDLDALILKALYEERLTLTLAYLLNAETPEIMKAKLPEAYRHYEKMQDLYNQIDDLGYEELPDDLYARWLEYIANNKEKYPNKK
ncbi:MAG: hypothetical protein LBP83_03260 [Dysgonamonadaceae bacterium]|jgi:hypothetical protein|nr:hypothetical protein [Dysgonamonadaceae bacterium]